MKKIMTFIYIKYIYIYIRTGLFVFPAFMVACFLAHQNHPPQSSEEWIHLIPKDKAVGPSIRDRSAIVPHHPLPPFTPKKPRGDFWFSGFYIGMFHADFFFLAFEIVGDFFEKFTRRVMCFFCCLCFDPLQKKHREIFSILMLGILKDEGKFQIWSAAGFYSIGAGTGGAATKASGRDEWGDSCTPNWKGGEWWGQCFLFPLDY